MPAAARAQLVEHDRGHGRRAGPRRAPDRGGAPCGSPISSTSPRFVVSLVALRADARGAAAGRRRTAERATRSKRACATRAAVRSYSARYIVDMNAMFFGMPMALFPASPRRYGGAACCGLLYAAPRFGVAARRRATSGWTGASDRHGLARRARRRVLGRRPSSASGCASLAVAGARRVLVIAGAADMISGLFRMTHVEPDHPRPAARTARGHRDGELH